MKIYITGAFLALLAFIGFVAFISSATVIGAGKQGVVTRFGAIKDKTLEPGFHFVAPFIDNVKVFDVKEQKEEVEAGSASKDLQSVSAVIALNYHLDPNKVNQLYQELGTDYRNRIINPAIQESVKSATAQFSAEELITKRQKVREAVVSALTAKLSRRYIVLDDLSIVNFNFSTDFNKSIEQKQVAEQNALKAQQDLKRIEVEAKQKIEQAKAEAESLKLQKQQVTTELIELRKIEAQLEAIKKWDGKLPTYSGGTIPFIQLPQAK